MSDKLREHLADPNSYAATFMYGSDGKGGLWKTRNVPAKYSDCWLENFDISENNSVAQRTIEKYCNSIIEYVTEKKVGLFLFGKPSENNPLSVGTGKTTASVTCLNMFLYERLRQHLRGEVLIHDNPVYFMRANDLQINFNNQFKGSFQQKEDASIKFSAIKARAMAVELLVFDDIATKGATDAFKEELYSLIDFRMSNDLPVIYTSNVPVTELAELLGDRISSRIEGSTVQVAFGGADLRKKVL